MGFRGREILGLAIVAMTMVTAGQTARAEESSTTSVQAVQPSVLDNFTLSYWGNWRGPSLGSFNGYTPLPTGEEANRATHDDVLWGDNVITAGYKLTPERIISYNFTFKTNLAKDPDANGGAGSGVGKSSLTNNYIGIRDKKLANTAGINHDVMIRLYVPTSESSQKANMILAPAVVDNATFDVGDFTFALWSRARYYIADTGPAWTLDMAPYANWQFSKKVAATMWIDAVQLAKVRGKPVENAYVDIEPGINWDITPNISVNPYLNIYPQSLTANATSVQMIISAKAF